MKSTTRRRVLVVAMLIAALFAAWSWLRPYDWVADPAARCRIVGCMVKQDRSNFWVRMHLKVSSGEEHDLAKPVRLVTAGGREIAPADTTLSGDGQQQTRQLWLSFWLEKEDLDGVLRLKINNGDLLVRRSSGVPVLDSDGDRYFVTNYW